MTSVHLKAHVDKDGILKLRTSVEGISDQDVEVTLVIQPQPSNKQGVDLRKSSGWPQGFFEETAGAWQGEPLTRPPQGEFEAREELE